MGVGVAVPKGQEVETGRERSVPGRGSKRGGLGRTRLVWPRGSWRTGGRAGSAGDTSLSRPSKTLATSEVTDGSPGETTPEQEQKPCSASTPCGSRPPPACIPHWGFSPLIYSYFSSQSGPSQALRTSWFSSGFSAAGESERKFQAAYWDHGVPKMNVRLAAAWLWPAASELGALPAVGLWRWGSVAVGAGKTGRGGAGELPTPACSNPQSLWVPFLPWKRVLQVWLNLSLIGNQVSNKGDFISGRGEGG